MASFVLPELWLYCYSIGSNSRGVTFLICHLFLSIFECGLQINETLLQRTILLIEYHHTPSVLELKIKALAKISFNVIPIEKQQTKLIIILYLNINFNR